MTRIRLCILLCLIAGVNVCAQELGLRSPKVKYYQIETPVVRVIFPEDAESTAQHVAGIMTYMSRLYPIGDGELFKKIPVILQNATDIPNGYVELGPWRSEMYISPPPSSFALGSLDWTTLLAIHEFRHVQQLSTAKRGLTALAYYLFGEEAYSGMAHLSWPNWYIEGDAVVAETVLSMQGRGRLPAFLNGYRAKILSGEDWAYAKVRNGSLKEWIPDHYRLGFLLQNYGRVRHGQDFWDRIAQESAAYEGLIYPFSAAMKRYAGVSSIEFYHNAMAYYRDLWKTDTTGMTDGQPVVAEDMERYRNFSYPAFGDNGALYAAMRSFSEIEAIHRITPEGPERIVAMGFQNEPSFSYANGKFAWTELRLHPRWVREDYSSIVVFDTGTGKKQTITQRESYFSPALSPSGERVVAVADKNDRQEYALRILDVDDGTILHELSNPDNLYFTFPVWSEDERVIYSAVRDKTGRMALCRQTVADESVRILTPWTTNPIGRPCLYRGWIYFTMSDDLTDQIFRLSLEDGDIQQLTFGDQSNYQPVVDPVSGDLVFSQFTLNGHRLRRLGAADLSPGAGRMRSVERSYVYTGTEEQQIMKEIPEREYPVRKYPRLSRPVYLHSWSLFEEDPVYGVEILSENALSSVYWRSGVQWNSNDDSWGPFTQITIGEWYPEILFTYSGWKRTRTIEDQKFRWFQHSIGGGLRLPFQGYYGASSIAASLSSRINRLVTTGDIDIGFTYLSHSLALVHRRKSAIQHPMTRFGQAVRISQSHAIDTAVASQFQVQTDFAFPSPFRNHVLWLQADYKHELRSNTLIFNDFFEYARGYSAVGADDILRLGFNYHFPLAYPDLGIAGIVYCKRVRLNAFADWSRAWMEDDEADFRSAGAEILMDLEIFNVEPVTVAFRWSHLFDTDPQHEGRMYKFGFFTPVERL